MPAIWQAGGGAGPRDDKIKGPKQRFAGVARGFRRALRAEVVNGMIVMIDEPKSESFRAALAAQREPISQPWRRTGTR